MFLDALQINSTQNNVNSVAFLLVFFECWEDSSLHYEVPNASAKIKTYKLVIIYCENIIIVGILLTQYYFFVVL